MAASLFTAPDTWLNGYYELAIELGPRSDERLRLALEAVWDLDELDGPYERRDLEPDAQPRVPPTAEGIDSGHLLGVATLPGGGRAGGRAACGTCAVREEDGPDWLLLYLPMGALERVYDVGMFPFDRGADSKPWRTPLDAWLVRAASAAFGASPFQLALVGHEVSGSAYANGLAGRGIPAERGIGYLWREAGKLVWHPPTNG